MSCNKYPKCLLPTHTTSPLEIYFDLRLHGGQWMLLTLYVLRIHLRRTNFSTLSYLELLLSFLKSQVPAYLGIKVSIPTTKMGLKKLHLREWSPPRTCVTLSHFFSKTCETPHIYIFYFFCLHQSIILKLLKTQFSHMSVCENISQIVFNMMTKLI